MWLYSRSSLLLLLAVVRGTAAGEPISDAAWAGAGTRFGVTFMKTLASQESSPFATPQNDRLSAVQNRALMTTLFEYKKGKAKLDSTGTGLKGTLQLAVDGTAVTLATSGVGLVPAVIAKTAGQLTVDYLSAQIDAKISQTVDLMLSRKKDEILAIAGNDISSLRGKSPLELKELLKNGSSAYRSMEEALPGDPKVRALAEDLMITGLQNVTLEALNRMQINSESLSQASREMADLAGKVSKYQSNTVSALETSRQSIKDLATSVDELSSAVKGMREKADAQTPSNALVVHFVLERMSASERVAALEAGLLDSQFSCPGATPNCGAAELKAKTILAAKAEARAQEISSTLVKGANGLNDIATIGRNIFGIDSPQLNTVVKYSSVAAQAFTQYASFNYLGGSCISFNAIGRGSP